MLPISSILPGIITALATHSAVVIEAPPGAGKTTGVPLALLDSPWLAGKRIVMLEPRRLAARAAAHRMAFLLGEAVGETVGYRMRFDTRVGPRTRIEVITEGVLVRMLQRDLALEGVGLVIFDEFHERALAADAGLALVDAVRTSLRDDLRILVMSATLDGDAVARLLDDAPVIRSMGRAFPVEVRYAPPREPLQEWLPHRAVSHVVSVIRDTLAHETGSVLVFFPGAGDIRRAQDMLDGTVAANVSVHALHGSLETDAQDAAIAPPAAGHRKVVLATNIAETSLTIEGIRVVIDAGWMRVPRFSPRTGMARLETIRVSRSSADQRAGRAGRTEPGSCIRCWPAHDTPGLLPYTRAEIVDADLAPLVLDLAATGFRDPGELRWLDPPPDAAIAQGHELLLMLGAIDAEGMITHHGRAMAQAGMHPRLAHMLLRARSAEDRSMAATLAALLEERDMLRGDGVPPPADVQLRLDIVAREDQVNLLGHATVDRHIVQRIRTTARQFLRAELKGDRVRALMPNSGAGTLLASAYPDRVAHRRESAGRFVLRNGRGATLSTHDPLAQHEWLVAAEIEDTGRDARISLAAPLTLESVMEEFGDQIETSDSVEWDSATRAVQSRRRTKLGAIVLRDVAINDADPDTVAQVLVAGVASDGIAMLPWGDNAMALRHRMHFAHVHDAAWPPVSDAALLEKLPMWLGSAIQGKRKIADITDAELARGLQGLLTWQQREQLDVLAPVRIEVPTGSRIAVDYTDPMSPVLAVRLQEVFGMTETPRVMQGRVSVTMQLLSPGYRPVQTTRDLASFWRTGYFDVRKDMRGRYPKHAWPENPLEAAPVRGGGRASKR